MRIFEPVVRLCSRAYFEQVKLGDFGLSKDAHQEEDMQDAAAAAAGSAAAAELLALSSTTSAGANYTTGVRRWLHWL